MLNRLLYISFLLGGDYVNRLPAQHLLTAITVIAQRLFILNKQDQVKLKTSH